jgi:hypothetical protein
MVPWPDRVALRIQRLWDERPDRSPASVVAASFRSVLAAAVGQLRYGVQEHSAGVAVVERRSGDIVFFNADRALALSVAAEYNRNPPPAA